VDELELSVRSYNCLKNANIQTIRDLVQRTEAEMLRTKNFGRKSLNEIKEILKGLGLQFGMKFDAQGRLIMPAAAAAPQETRAEAAEPPAPEVPPPAAESEEARPLEPESLSE